MEDALDALRAGEIIGLPTDTVYGIAADPMQQSAVRLLFEAKGRSAVKPIPILAATLRDVRRIAELDEEVAAIADRHWPGALTLILRRVSDAPAWVGDPKSNTVGVRVPDHPVALEVLAAAGPLAVTSANQSSERPALDAILARGMLADSVSVYLPGSADDGVASTVVDLTRAKARVLRQGNVHWGAS